MRRAWLCLAAFTLNAQAQGLRVEVMPLATYFEAREFLQSGALFNREDGRLQGARITLGHGVRTPLGPVELQFRHRHASGTVRYLGLTQGGFPILTTTVNQLERQAVSASRAWQLGRGFSADAGVVLSTHRFDRSIQPLINLPLQELLRERSAGLELGIAASPRRWLGQGWVPQQISYRHTLERTRQAALEVNSFGIQDFITLTPAKSAHSERRLQLQWPLAAGAALLWQRSITAHAPGASPTEIWTSGGVPTSTVRYPGAQIYQAETALGLSLSW
jgi:hypothetical protein